MRELTHHMPHQNVLPYLVVYMTVYAASVSFKELAKYCACSIALNQGIGLQQGMKIMLVGW